MALIGVLAGAGWVELVRAARRRAGLVAGVVLATAGLAAAAQAAGTEEPVWRGQWHAVGYEAAGIRDLPRVIARAGGAADIARCGPVFTTRFEVPAVAWSLHRHLREVDIFPLSPGVTFAQRGTALSRDPRFPVFAGSARWVAGHDCRRPG